MEILTLKFVSPKVLNELGESRAINREVWTLEETQEELELNTENWMIRSGETEAKINHWKVNQKTHRMQLKSVEGTEDFESLDYPFAVSMIGQIGNKKNLQDYLASLQEIYLIEFHEETHITFIKSNSE